MLKLYDYQKDEEIFNNLSLFNSSDLGFDSKRFTFFAVFVVDILPLGSGSVDPKCCGSGS